MSTPQAQVNVGDQRWLEEYLRELGAVAGTVHRAAPGGLTLCAAWHIPPPVAAAVQWVPEGKGMAGCAQVTGKPVTTCNLQDDANAAVRPGARAVAAQAAAALPIFHPDGSVRAVVGAAWADERHLSEQVLAQYQRRADTLPDTSSASNRLLKNSDFV